MRARFETILAAAVALCVGVAAGWFAAGAWGERKCGNVELCNCGNVETANDGRARSPVSPERSEPRKRWLQGCAPKEKAKSRRKAPIRSSADAEVQKRILENKISYLEKCIAAAKVSDAKPAEKKRETNAEIVERLMKLPTENERWTAFNRLDEKMQMSFTMGELKRLCPEHIELAMPTATDHLNKLTAVAARRIGILDALDPSGLNDEERKVHAEFMDFLAEYPNVFANMIDQPDSMTWGEAHDRIEKMISTVKRGPDLIKKEREMLIAETVKSFGILDGDAADLRATLDEVQDVTRFMYFEEKD